MLPQKDIIGLIALSFDDEGSQFVIKKLRNGSDDLRKEYFDEVIPCIRELSALGLYSNRIIKYFLELSNEQQWQELVKMVVYNFKQLCVDRSGCYVVASFIEKMTSEGKSIVLALGTEEIVILCTNSYATYVVQKCIRIEASLKNQIFEKIKFQIARLSMDYHGYHVVKCILDYGTGYQVDYICNTILLEFDLFVKNCHGASVIQHVLRKHK